MYRYFIKPLLDFIIASIMLLCFLPLFLLLAIIIKLTSKGPVFFQQERGGLNGNYFKILKFRSMTVKENSDGKEFDAGSDLRVTGIGKILRKSKLDELPQLINVIKGDMSLVGPRPERQFFVEKFNQRIPHYMARHVVKTGITGWAQVNGLRGQCPIEERTRYDIWYIENWSLWLDLVILVRTVYVCVFKPTGF